MKKIIVIVFGLLTAAFTISASHSIDKKQKTVFILEVTPHPDSIAEVGNNEEQLAKYCQILRKRCESIRVKAIRINPEKGTSQTNLIRVELKGARNTERIRKLLTSSTNLGLWEMYRLNEVHPFIVSANDKLSTLIADTHKTEEEIHRKDPLLCLLQLEMFTDLRSAQIGNTSYQDTATVNKYLNIPEIKAIFPKDLQWKWASIWDKRRTYFELYALKVTEKDGKALLRESVIENAESEDDYYGKPCLGISMNSDGAKRWAQMTKNNIDRPIAITLNNQLYSAPWVNSEITAGYLQVVGNFSKEDTQDWACQLKSGSLPGSVKILQTIIITDD